MTDLSRWLGMFLLKAMMLLVFSVGIFFETGPITVIFVICTFLFTEWQYYSWYRKKARIQELWATQSKNLRDTTSEEKSEAKIPVDVVVGDGSTGSDLDQFD